MTHAWSRRIARFQLERRARESIRPLAHREYALDRVTPRHRNPACAHDGDTPAACHALVAQVTDTIFRRLDSNRLLAVRLRSGHNKTLYRSDLLSGAILASIVQRAKELAIERTIQSIENPTTAGLTVDDVLRSVDTEFHEGEMLPPDDAAEEWLKLLDHHPEQVVGISSYRRGRISEERLVGQII